MNLRVLLDALVGSGTVPEHQRAPLRRRLEDENRVSTEGAVKALVESERCATRGEAWRRVAESFGMKYRDLREHPPREELVEQFDGSVLHRYRVLPLEVRSGVLRVAVCEPPGVRRKDDLRALFGERLSFVLTGETPLMDHLEERVANDEEDVGEVLNDFEEESPGEDPEIDPGRAGGDPPVIKLVNALMVEAVQRRASDVHAEPRDDELVVRFRIDGELRTVHRIPRELHGPVVNRVKLLAGMNLDESRIPQDGRLSVPGRARSVEVRVSTVPGRQGECVVLRLLDDEGLGRSLDGLGFRGKQRRLLGRLLGSGHGLVLATGPTGSGKTTTLYAALRDLPSDSLKIITLEDPVEYRLPGINQVQVNPTLDRGFGEGLRALLRQNPDVLLVGEIRDRTTARTALRAALTGHRVFSTLHTNDAPRAVDRLRDLDVDPHLIGASLRAVLAQRLVRVPCSHCRGEHRPGPGERRMLGETKTLPDGDYVRARGCSRCEGTGYSGRTPLAEILVVNSSLRRAIREGDPVGEIRRRAREAGMRSLREDGVRLASRGQTTLEEVARVTPPGPSLDPHEGSPGS